MKLEFEILDEDLADGKKLLELVLLVKDKFADLSEYAQNTIKHADESTISELEIAYTKWVRILKERLCSDLQTKLDDIFKIEVNLNNDDD